MSADASYQDSISAVLELARDQLKVLRKEANSIIADAEARLAVVEELHRSLSLVESIEPEDQE